MIAALYVKKGGPYYGIADVDPWDVDRDARAYAGPHPVVAHPPCARWCRLAGLVEARWGHKRGEDDGCFASALASVRRWGGVLEHPAYSDAWPAHKLNKPPTGGHWVNADFEGGWTCVPDTEVKALVSWCGNNVRSGESRPRVGKAAAARTPKAFRDALLAMARSVERSAA